MVLYKDFQLWESCNNARCLISPISCWHVTRLSRRSVRLMNERQNLHRSKSKVVCRNFFELWLLKHWKICIAYRQLSLNWWKQKVTYSVAWVMAFFAAETEKNRKLEDLPQADFGRVPWRFLMSIRTNWITENFAYWKVGPMFVFVVIQYTWRFLFADYRSFDFIH